MFFVGKVTGVFSSLLSAVILAGMIVLGNAIFFYLGTTALPETKIGKVIVRSIFDRTIFVLARAVVIAAPAGLVIWLMANLSIGDMTILTHCTRALDPFAKMLGMDGVILIAFILGLPANEIVIPIMIMTYMAQGSLMEINDLDVLKQLLVQNGWTWVTAVSTMLFTLMHWPCSTTCLTIHKETQSIKWTLVSVVVPAVVGKSVSFRLLFLTGT